MQDIRLSPPALALVRRSESAQQAMLVLLFGALTAVGAQLSIPLQPVPLTGQVFMVLLSGALLGPRLGLLSQLTYLAIGFLGAPVFAGGKATALVLLGPTAGYLIGFPLAAWVAGTLARRVSSLPALLASLLAADALLLLIGGLWLGAAAALGGADPGSGLLLGLRTGVLPFVGIDAVKAAAAALVAWPLIRKSG